MGSDASEFDEARDAVLDGYDLTPCIMCYMYLESAKGILKGPAYGVSTTRCMGYTDIAHTFWIYPELLNSFCCKCPLCLGRFVRTNHRLQWRRISNSKFIGRLIDIHGTTMSLPPSCSGHPRCRMSTIDKGRTWIPLDGNIECYSTTYIVSGSRSSLLPTPIGL